MTKLVRLATAAALLLFATAMTAQEVKDATIADPDVHQVKLENDHVRVFRALAAAGHKSPMHSHPPFLVLSLGTARMRVTQADGTKQILDLEPGAAIWIDGAEHSWELLAGELNVIGVEVKSAKAATAAKPAKGE
jgi:quercetin dioxygenase-like cupin family protein